MSYRGIHVVVIEIPEKQVGLGANYRYREDRR
jgi:hypothetical protein